MTQSEQTEVKLLRDKSKNVSIEGPESSRVEAWPPVTGPSCGLKRTEEDATHWANSHLRKHARVVPGACGAQVLSWCQSRVLWWLLFLCTPWNRWDFKTFPLPSVLKVTPCLFRKTASWFSLFRYFKPTVDKHKDGRCHGVWPPHWASGYSFKHILRALCFVAQDLESKPSHILNMPRQERLQIISLSCYHSLLFGHHRQEN